MEAYKLEGTEFTPKVHLNPDSFPFLFEGVSRPENASDFYEKIVQWLIIYAQSPKDKTEVEFRFNYFNTSSLKYFLMILSKLKDMVDEGHEVVIKWFYDEEDDSMLEAGKNLEELSELKFNFITN